MFEDSLHEVISGYVPHFWEKYDGNSNSDSQRNGRGCQEWKNGDFQKYSGEFFQDSLHGKGKYTCLRRSQSYMYEGGFYTNNFEGYANLIQTDGHYFEGLLKNNRRFGPGIVTYPDGRQDVGLWDGLKLRRLSSVIMPEWIPKLARTSSGKVKLLKFRRLVPLCPVEIDSAKEVLKKLGANSELMRKSDQLYNNYIRHTKSKLFNKKLHDEKYFGQTDWTIEVADSEALQANFDSVSFNLIQNNIVGEVLDIVLENVDLLRDVPQENKREILAEKLEEMRQNYRMHLNENFVKSLMENLLENIEDLITRPREERVLICNKIVIQNFLRSIKIENDFPTKKIEVTDLLAWNNESISIAMMKHIFLHRNMENSVSFRVTKLLAGDRATFNACGDHERICTLFLTNCSVGNDEIIDNIFMNYDVHHNLCDARGNASITFAAARDRWSIIRKLTNVGVNLDVLNDEGLTPLVLCLLRYLAVKNSVSDWESAFLTNTIVKPEEEFKIKTEWRPHASLTNLNMASVTTLYETYAELNKGLEKMNLFNNPNPFRISEDSGDLPLDSLRNVCDEIRSMEINMAFRNFQGPYIDVNGLDTQTYIFKAKCNMPTVKTKPEKLNVSTDDFITSNKLKIVFTTIKILLSCGANPNIGQAPLPALIICLFCENEELLNLLLASLADPNITTMDENLSPLHILASLPFSKENADMFRTLLVHHADPNCKANVYHWMEEKDGIIGKHVLEEEDLGKTPLHILCMRYDFNDDTQGFLLEMVKHLIDFKANVSEYYLGHTPFSLAVLRGNLKLIKFFLDTSTVDPHENLGEGMGVALTVPILKRYANVIQLPTAIDVYDLLMQYYVNPLRDVGEVGNAIEFMYKEHESEDIKNTPPKKNQNSSKKKPSSTDETKDYLLKCARKMLHRHIQYNAFKYLTYFILENSDLNDEVSNILVKFLTLSDAERIIQILLRKSIFAPNDSTYYISMQILQCIKNSQSNLKKGKAKEDQRTPEDILNNLDFSTTDTVNKFGLIEPEVDPNKHRYIICFYCGRKVGKILIACPNCGLVYFCSEECNKLSIKKQADLHHCGVLFYNREKKRQEEYLAKGLKYDFRSKLDEKLDEIKRAILLRYLERGGGDGLEIDLEKDFDLLNLGEGKFAGAFGSDQDVRRSGAPWFSGQDYLQEVGKKKMVDESKSKLDKKPSRTIEGEKGMKTDYLEKEAKSRRKDKSSRTTEKDKEMGAISLIEQTKRERKDKLSRTTKIDKEMRAVSLAEETKGGRKDKSSRPKERDKEMRAVSLQEETKDKRRGKGVRIDEKEGKRKQTGRRGGVEQDVKYKHEAKGARIKKDGIGKGKTGRKAELEEKISRKDGVTTKITKGTEKGALSDERRGPLKYGKKRERVLGQAPSDKREGKAGMGKQLEYATGTELEMDRTKKPLYRKGYELDVRRKGYEYEDVDAYTRSKLSKRYQHFLEILGEYFPDLDLCMLFLPYACFVDGQLYYRFLDERPLFCLTYSNV